MEVKKNRTSVFTQKSQHDTNNVKKCNLTKLTTRTPLRQVIHEKWTQVLRKGTQFLLHMWHPLCYYCYKPCDNGRNRGLINHDGRNRRLVNHGGRNKCSNNQPIKLYCGNRCLANHGGRNRYTANHGGRNGY